MSTVRAMYISDDITRWDHDRSAETPVDGLTDLSKLLARMTAVSHPHGMTLLLSSKAAQELGFPAKLPGKLVQDHPVLNGARATGWMVDSISPWMTFLRHNADVHVGIVPWLNQRNFMFHNADPSVMVTQLYRFHRLIGVPYHGSTPGLASLSLLRDFHNGRSPMWKPRNWDEIEAATMPTEVAPDWTLHDDHGMPFEHVYDMRRQFLSSAGYATLALGELEPRTGAEVPPSLAPIPGYYQVSTPAWALNHLLPHPIGNGAQYGQLRWVTAPTLGLLFELADQRGVLDYPHVHQAWVAKQVYGKTGYPPVHSGRPLHRWATRIGEAIDLAEVTRDPQMISATKDLYKHGLGMLERPRARVYRPDWAHTVIALARANQFRKIWATYHAEGRVPVRVEHDQVTYTSQSADPELNWPIGFNKAPDHGGYTVKGTRTLEIQA